MIYKIAICDDNDTDIQYISHLISYWANSMNIKTHIHTFSSAEEFLFHYEEEKDYDILLLDIEMKQMDGVTLAKTIRKKMTLCKLYLSLVIPTIYQKAMMSLHYTI